MEPSHKPLKEWFGYSRRERRSTFILLMIIGLVTGVRYLVPDSRATIEEVQIEIPAAVGERFSFAGSDPLPGRPKSAVNKREQKPLLDLNRCDSASLVALPGIGPVLSVRILKYRNLLGGYARVSQLREVYGLPEETFNLISGRVFADSTAVRKIVINRADFKELIRLPYFDRTEVSAILRYRDVEGRVSGIGELVSNRIISSETAGKVRPYLDFDN